MMQEINKLSRVIELLRKQLNKDLPSQHIALLLAVARQPGITMPELCRELDMPQGTVSRNVKLMSSYSDVRGGEVKRKGYGLLETDQAPANRYQLAVFLTGEGERLVEKLVQAMEQGTNIDMVRDGNSDKSYSLSKQMLS